MRSRESFATENKTLAKLRHIAILVADPEASATFFERAFDLKRVGYARCGVYLSDGTVNIALLKIETEDEKPGVAHFGMWVDDLAEAERQAARFSLRVLYRFGFSVFAECEGRGVSA
jgi:predicted enzyme related to lactoylglutathione lyase